MAKQLHKIPSRITLADLFGNEAGPTEADIAEAAKNVAKDRLKEKRREADRQDRRDPGHERRLQAIAAAAHACNTQPEWAKSWHATARVFVIARTECGTCGKHYDAPGATGWLVEYTHKRNGSTHTTDVSGPIDRRLPVKRVIHRGRATVCQHCAFGFVEWPPAWTFVLALPTPKSLTQESLTQAQTQSQTQSPESK